MAVEEFRGTFLPRADLQKYFGEVPKYLPGEGNGFEIDMRSDNDDGYVNYYYWEDFDFEELTNIFGKVFTVETKSSLEYAKEYGYEQGVKLEIYDRDPEDSFDSKDICLKIYIKDYNKGLLKTIFEAFYDLDALYVIADTGEVIESDYQLFMEKFKKTRRYNMVNRSL